VLRRVPELDRYLMVVSRVLADPDMRHLLSVSPRNTDASVGAEAEPSNPNADGATPGVSPLTFPTSGGGLTAREQQVGGARPRQRRPGGGTAGRCMAGKRRRW
jgi:hypothetical protein